MPRQLSKEEKHRLLHWVKQGRAIEVGASLLAQSPNAQSLSLQDVFAAGASFLFDLVVFCISDGPLPTNEDQLLMARLHDELVIADQRLRQVIASNVPEQDKPS